MKTLGFEHIMMVKCSKALGLEWIAGIREMDAAESRSAQWVLSRAQGVPPDGCC